MGNKTDEQEIKGTSWVQSNVFHRGMATEITLYPIVGIDNFQTALTGRNKSWMERVGLVVAFINKLPPWSLYFEGKFPGIQGPGIELFADELCPHYCANPQNV